jgi:subtilisin family serine protease/uncharacterized protein YbcV (DUF1398 family)
MFRNIILLSFTTLLISFITKEDKVSALSLGDLRVIVIYEEEMNKEIIREATGDIIDEMQELNAVIADVPVSSLKMVENHPKVKLVEIDQIMKVETQSVGWGLTKIGSPISWESSITGKGVKVAVLDSGISPHEDLDVVGGVSFVSYTDSYYDDNGHGTHVAGIIGAKNNGIGIVGAAPDASIYSVKVMDKNGQGYLSDLLAGIEWSIANKMDIVNLSIGSTTGSYLLKQSVDKAFTNGLLVVAAGGNNGTAKGLEDTVEYPAKYDSVIGVSATDSNNTRPTFSATGEKIEVAAPGVGILSTAINNKYVYMSGTSMATPYVTGNLALLKQAYPHLTNIQLRELLQTMAKDIGGAGKDSFYGFGLIQTPTVKGWDVEYVQNQLVIGRDVYFLKDINTNWGLGSPDPLVPSDNITVRYTKTEHFEGGWYLFEGAADDAIRVSLDGQEILYHSGNVPITKLVEISEGSHNLSVDHIEGIGHARMTFRYLKLPSFSSLDKNVGFNWGAGSPNANTPVNRYMWSFDQSNFFSSGDYFIQAFADDGVRVEIDGTKIIDRLGNYNGLIDRSIWSNVSEGYHTVKTTYYENIATAGVFSHIVPFGSWLAYYYPNPNLSGLPNAAKIISPIGSNDQLSEHYSGSPASNVSADHFSVRFTTAKRLKAGDYILRTKVDDGIRVYIDGKLVLDRWGKLGEEAVKVTLTDNVSSKKGDEDVHWVEVEYREDVFTGYVNVSLLPFELEITNQWIAEYYPNMTLSGIPYVVGGNNGSKKISSVHFNWGTTGTPHPSIPTDRFGARFTKREYFEAGKYLFKVHADDAARVYVDGQLIIDTWPSSQHKMNQKWLELSGEDHTIVVEYMENVGNANISLSYNKYMEIPTVMGKEVHYNWGSGSPGLGLPINYFIGVFDQSGVYSEGDYFIQTFADDGVKVEVNGQSVIDRFTDYTGGVERALWAGVSNGNHSIKTTYLENVASAGLFSDIVPFDTWLAYYYTNKTASGLPKSVKTLAPDGDQKGLSEYFLGSPTDGIGKDHFSVKYVTAKRMTAGEYILRTKADDGIRIYVDGKLVLDRWFKLGEEAVKLQITDNETANNGEKDVHWIEVVYREDVSVGYVNVWLEPFQHAIQDTWVGEYYPNNSFKGIPFVAGGNQTSKKIQTLDFNWGWTGSPHPSIPSNHFTARFSRKEIFSGGKYLLQVQADDAARVFVDGNLILDTWPGTNNKINQSFVDISQGEHMIVVEYLENVALSALSFTYQK